MAVGTGAAIIGGSLLSGLLSSKGASAQAKSADAASAEAARQFDITRGDLLPYIQTGQSALGRLAQLYGLGGGSAQALASPTQAPAAVGNGLGWLGVVNRARAERAAAPTTGQPAQAAQGTPDMSAFFASPDYQFRMQEGQRAIDRSLAARGKALSGQGVREGERYASGLASQEFGSFFDRLASLAGIGQTGAAQSAAAGSNTASQIGNASMYGGAARASGYAGINNSIQGGLSNYLLLQQLQQQSPSIASRYGTAGGGFG